MILLMRETISSMIEDSRLITYPMAAHSSAGAPATPAPIVTLRLIIVYVQILRTIQKRKSPVDVDLRGFSMYGGEIGI